MIHIVITILVLVVLIRCSAFFSASETALTSISRLSLRQMIKEKKKNAKKIQKLLSNKPRLLTTILIGNNFVNIFSSSIATALAVSLFGEKGVGIATLVMTFLIIIFGEVFPKTQAAQNPKGFAQFSAPILLVLQKILFPIVWLFTLVTKGIDRFIALFWKQHTPIISEEELKSIIEVGNQEGVLENSEKEMLHKVFEFTDLRVRDIMKRRVSITTIAETARLPEIIRTFKETGFSRLPVCEAKNSLPGENIIGMLHYKDVLFYVSDKTVKSPFHLKERIRPALFVPEIQDAVSLLHTFHSTAQNMAIAVNEHGSVSGLVTMDDILQAVFGNIVDEYSNPELPAEERIIIISPTEFHVPGNIELSDVNQIFNLQLESDFYHTLGGYLLESFGSLPAVGEYFKTDKAEFTVLEQHHRRIQAVDVKICSTENTGMI